MKSETFDRIDKWKRGLAIEILYFATGAAVAMMLATQAQLVWKYQPLKPGGVFTLCDIQICIA